MPMPTSVPSGNLIRQPFGHNTPTLQTGQTGQRSRSIGLGQTVTCNGRPTTKRNQTFYFTSVKTKASTWLGTENIGLLHCCKFKNVLLEPLSKLVIGPALGAWLIRHSVNDDDDTANDRRRKLEQNCIATSS